MSAIPAHGVAIDLHRGHAIWVRVAHWFIVASVLTLVFSGVAILVAHPRLYWGQTGNSLTMPLIELPLGPNYHNIPFGPATHFFGPNGPVSQPRLREVYNLNGWARSLHFIVAWTLAFSLGAYLLVSLVSGHFTRWLLPSGAELSPANISADIRAHMSLRPPQTSGGPPYNLLQKLAYLGVAFVGLPVMVITGLAMSPAFTATFPILMDITGGYQSARTIHFLMMCLIVVFLIVHLAMMALTGFGRQLRAMTVGR
ncbi:MAG TPA: cytochrome b/b6 domain-containing protein [Rhizomicrobium sp.]|nr:cytochrome b/b6 domain-containing protein [Rhizomicrobium sp.]